MYCSWIVLSNSCLALITVSSTILSTILLIGSCFGIRTKILNCKTLRLKVIDVSGKVDNLAEALATEEFCNYIRFLLLNTAVVVGLIARITLKGRPIALQVTVTVINEDVFYVSYINAVILHTFN